VIARCFAPRRDDGHEVSTRDGRRISIATRSLQKDGQIILLTDQTETRRLQGELSRHERLSALGKMVSALAHQIRTPLSAAMLYAGHLCNNKINQDKRQQFSEKLLRRLNHMERQVQDMLLFVKGELPLNDWISLKELQEVLAEEIEVAVASAKADISWHNDCGDRFIQCHREALNGALINLVNNAIQAVDGEARIHIRFTFMEGERIAISVLDNGPGISPDLMATVSDLFVTTKPQGTGLGLAVVQAVAKAHSGKFELRSLPNKGTSATLIMPLTDFESAKFSDHSTLSSGQSFGSLSSSAA
jgi:two-component system sensor histidine kinase FlrB